MHKENFSTKLYIVAGYYSHAKHFADSKRQPFIYINQADHLRGLRGITLYCLSTAYSLKNFSEIIEIAKRNNFNIIYLQEENIV